MKGGPPSWLAGLLLLLALGGSMLWARQGHGFQDTPEGLVLLIPDDAVAHHPVTQAWRDAAQEEGIALEVMTDDAFVRARANRQTMAGVILPDTVHRQASDVLVNTLYQYAQTGGQVMVGFDAALLSPLQPTYAAPRSRLSALVGVSYGLYGELRQHTTVQGPVQVSRTGQRLLAIQPGKLDFADEQLSSWGELTTYGYPTLSYSHFRTANAQDILTLIRSGEGDPVVSTHAHGQGQVLFANLPLGYLKTRTDSYLLHRLLVFFARDMARQTTLSPTPHGLGGMVLNLHVDSNAAQAHLQELENKGWFDQGPYVIHVTAGPDTYAAGDRMGIDLDHNPWMQAFLRRLHERGHEIGNHGGWIHNIFGQQVHAHNRSRFEPWLELNHQAVSRSIGQRVTSYSAPEGNQPDWVTAWLEQQAFKAYYSTSDTGLGPTRSYLQGQAAGTSRLWTFPISNFRQIATMDELEPHRLQEKDIRAFIEALLDHVSQQGIVRLFYFHPPVSREYRGALQALQSTAQRLSAEGRFRWYGMSELADFQNRRMAVQWRTCGPPAHRQLVAAARDTLEGMTWLIPASLPQTPQVTRGQARITQRNGFWQVEAGDVQVLHLSWAEAH